MAKLSAHGTETARFERIDDEETRTTYSLRSHRTVLRKQDWMAVDGRRYGGQWKLIGRKADLDAVIERLAGRGYRRV